jgi:hypothetical protein
MTTLTDTFPTMPTTTATGSSTTGSASTAVGVSTEAPEASGVVGGPRVILRLEGAALLVAATIAYAHLCALGWGLYAAVFFLPDLAFLGYLAGPRVGAAAYNTTHSLLGPAALALLGAVASMPTLLALALVWAAHVGFDRMFGYGLKYASAFGHTHLGRLGRDAR